MPPASTTLNPEQTALEPSPGAQRDAHAVRTASKDQRVVLVTGAASGIGRQLIIQMHHRGWIVAGLDENMGELEKLQRELGIDNFSWGRADVTDAAALELQVAKLSSELGRVDLLIAAAGIATPTPAIGMQPEVVAQVINVNLIGVANTIAAVLPGMLARRSGHIVAISSLATRGLPGKMAYSASKAGLNALMESLWLDVKDHGIMVTTVCPGHTRSAQTIGQYEDRFLMPVEETAARILKAIDGRKRFYAFPWRTVMELRILAVLPRWLQDWLVVRRMNEVRKK